MFDRRLYKSTAVAQLKGRWTIACILTLISGIIIGVIELSSADVALMGIISLCICGILLVALSFVFIKICVTADRVSFGDFIEGIETHWLNALLGYLWYVLWVFLWSCLFIIPGIIKAYSYSVMFFILAENPKITAAKAMNISKILTRNHKADLFCLDLSFFGWALLASVTCGIGYIWLYPYMSVAKANAYFDLKRMAFSQGLLSPSDFE